MNNITWSKTLANWGSNDQDFDPNRKDNFIVKKVTNIQDLINAKVVLQERTDELIQLTKELYNEFPSKELYDTVTSFESANRSLENIYTIK